VLIFGGLVPVLVPLLMVSFMRGNIGFVVPAQTFFGPAAFVLYLWLRRQGPERSMADWLTRAEAPDSDTSRAGAQLPPVIDSLRPVG
jgi:hypothetical protein